MAVVGGDIIEITFNHPTIGSGIIYPKSAEDSTLDTGGFRGADDANMIDGAGRTIRQLNRVRWSFETTVANDMNATQDIEKMVLIASSPDEAEWTFTHINGSVYAATGSPVGDLQLNTNQSTFTLKLSGGGVAKKII